MTLTTQQTLWLQWLHDNGGHGWLDQYGRVIANGANSKQGSQVSWLNLIVKGMVEAKEERFVITDKGMAMLSRRRAADRDAAVQTKTPPL